MTVILGIDPGSRVTGYGLIDTVDNKLEYVHCGCIKSLNETFPDRLKKIHAELLEVIDLHAPHQAAIEEVFVGRNASSALKLGQARGAAMVACLSHNLPIEEYSARQVKKAVAGTGSAAKNQVQYMVKALLKISDNIGEDAADALAIAICHANTQNNLIRMAGSKPYSKKHVRS
ncbi:MAG: crossover junction endodeoxyribonuclease RuvC [Pseudomonadota bacterium]|jgi:crossover junction endodeoxyribonuclease RuvC|nr:crossover junction endodeoxyribonuclease RuvC [Pseudomonadota bacterium]